MPNRLAHATSPYLLAHADNPVDWFEWGDAAFDEAKRRDVPVFLSVGYSACHWCHVMAHESFESPQIARIMNEFFVNIKVDREELPAVDSLYMQATQAMTGHGGWPMSVWLDHDRRPWYAGTYFPDTPRHGSPSFAQVLIALHDTWSTDRERVGDSAARIMERIADHAGVDISVGISREESVLGIQQGVNVLAADFDLVHGGFGQAPKFPTPMALQFLLDACGYWSVNSLDSDARALVMVENSCEAMGRGGMYDQLGGGFARYSVDATWTVPHFEKMLYDNTQLISLYTNLYVHTGNDFAARISQETADFVIRELTTPQGGFASALDADSVDTETGELEEGAFYAWAPQSVHDAVGNDANWACSLLGVTSEGTFEKGLSVLRRDHEPDDLERWRSVQARMLAHRALRPRPARDDKVVTAWNALAICALVKAGTVFQRPDLLEAAQAAADLLVSIHLGARPELPRRMVRVSRDGIAGTHAMGVLEDQALSAQAFLDLSQATQDQAWLVLAKTLLEDIQNNFSFNGALEDNATDIQGIIPGMDLHAVDPTDNVTPSGWSATVRAALTYSALTGDVELRVWAESLLPPLAKLASDHPRFAGNAASVMTVWLDGPREVALASAPTSDMIRSIYRATAPGVVYATADDHPLRQSRFMVDGEDTAYVCRGFVCDAPITTVHGLNSALGVRA